MDSLLTNRKQFQTLDQSLWNAGGKDRAGDTQRRVLYDWRSYLASFNAQITVVPATFQSADQAIHHAVLREVRDWGGGP